MMQVFIIQHFESPKYDEYKLAIIFFARHILNIA